MGILKNGKVRKFIVGVMMMAILFCCNSQVQADQERDFTYTVTDGQAEITRYTGTGGVVAIPNKLGGAAVTKIGTSAFYNCKGLTSVTIPESVTSIGNQVFRGCPLTSIAVDINNSTYASVDGVLFNKSRTVLIQCPAGLTRIVIPESVTSIGTLAFADCTGLTSISLPETVTDIGGYAFNNCTELKSINIPEGVTSIGAYAFTDTGLTSVTLPKSVTSVGDCAFRGCQDLSSFIVDKNNSAYASEGGVLFNKARTILIQCPARLNRVTIPENVTGIKGYAFYYCTGLTSVTIPYGVTGIAAGTFSHCTGLTSITIPQTVRGIGSPLSEGAFSNCTSLTSINIPENVTMIGEDTFLNCKSLTSIKIPPNVTNILFNAFNGCTGLTSISIPESAKYIDEQAFCNCTGLSSITFKSATTTIHDSGHTIPATAKIRGHEPSTAKTYADKYNRAFEVIKSTQHVDPDYTYTETNGEVVINQYTGAGGVVTIPGTLGGFPVTGIGGGAFGWNSDITSVIIPQGVTSIGGEAFSNCWNLTSVTFPQGLTSIGGWAFELTSLASITIPESVTYMHNLAFFGCPLTSITVDNNNSTYASEGGVLYDKAKTELIICPARLTGITIPPGVTRIDNYAFYNCQSLTSISLPVSLTSIGCNTFMNCKGLTSIVIPQGVTSIGDAAFDGCSSLTSISFPPGVKNISPGMFTGCSSLTSITVDINNSNYSSADGILFDKAKTVLIKCPQGVTNITIPPGVTSIGERAFSSCTGLTSLIIPQGVTNIERNAFSICTGLTSITIPDSVTSVGNMAFFYCPGLTSITFNSKTTEIYDNPETISTNTMIIGYDPSTAQAYAAKYNRDFDVIGNPNPLQSIAITTPAIKLTYNIGDPLDISGLVVTGTYQDGSTKAVIITAANITGFDSYTIAADQVLTITVKGKTTTYKVQIVAIGNTDTSGMIETKTVSPTTVRSDYAWTIKLNGLVNETSINGKIYVTNSQGFIQATDCTVASNNGLSQIEVKPSANYAPDNYILWVRDIESLKGTKIKNQVYLKFKVE